MEKYSGNKLTTAEKAVLAEKKNRVYKELLLKMTPADVTSEVRDTLTAIKARGYKVAVGSSSKNSKLILNQVKMLDAFDAISDGNNIKKSKPDPEVFLKAAEYLEIEPKNCLIVEDADAGIEAGIAAQMKTAAIGPAIHLKKADYDLKSFGDLLNILD
ncbi:MAG: HAD-IA family hydrolase [Lachnospiraceae bacterium]